MCFAGLPVSSPAVSASSGSSNPPLSSFCSASSTSESLASASFRRSLKPFGSSRSSAVGSRSGCCQMASRPSTPRSSLSEAHSAAASRSRRGRSSRPTREENACSAGPPVARRRRTVSRRAAAEGSIFSVAAQLSSSTQPSTRARAVSSFSSACSWAGVRCGMKTPCDRASWMPSGLPGSSSRASSSIFDVSMWMPRAYASIAPRRCPRSQGTWTNSRAWAASRTARNSRMSFSGRLRPSPNLATLEGSSAISRSASGTPISVELTTSADRAPMAWPSCMPKIAPPMFCSIEEAPPIMDFISSGICSVMAADSAFAMLLATGSVRRFQVPSVSSTHSARDQARPISPVAGRPVTWSSHSSASLRASSTSRDCCAVTDGSEPLAATRRAFSCASCQLTGPSEGGAHHGLDLGEHLGEEVRVVRKPRGLRQFRRVNVPHALAAHQVLQHFCQRILGFLVAVGRIKWVGGHDPADRRCGCFSRSRYPAASGLSAETRPRSLSAKSPASGRARSVRDWNICRRQPRRRLRTRCADQGVRRVPGRRHGEVLH